MDTDYDYSIQYRRFHDDSPEHAEMMANYLKEELRPYLPKPSGQKVLDVGCGMGFAILAMKKLGFENVQGIDIDQGQIQAGRALGLPVTHVADTATYLNENTGQFDIVLLLDVLEHISVQSQIQFLSAINSCLKPDAQIVVQVPNGNSMLASKWRYNDYTHTSSFTEHSLSFVLLNASFVNIFIPPLGQPRTRPSVNIWRSSSRKAWRKWCVRWIWKQVLIAELGEWENINALPIDLNLIAVAYKAGEA